MDIDFLYYYIVYTYYTVKLPYTELQFNEIFLRTLTFIINEYVIILGVGIIFVIFFMYADNI